MRNRMSERRLDELIDEGVAEAHRRWPGLPDLEVEFLATIQGRCEGEPDLAAAAGRLALPDLYLVTACLAGDRAAHAVLERLVREETTRAVAKLGGTNAEDVVQ